MEKIRISKRFSFDLAHALLHYDGLCKNVHGHTYHLTLTLLGSPINDINNPKNGMVVDFSDIKRIVFENIISKYDHALVINELSEKELIESLKKSEHKLHLTPYQPTCENLMIEIKNILIENIPKHLTLMKVRLEETPTSYAEWCKYDQSIDE
ncbi:MAG: 6-carboxytetrahydropterin synthase [Flavobacteriia bacterium]|nr:6-carboxytetrahydropterin synthase [Flavobacteriia bacterium]